MTLERILLIGRFAVAVISFVAGLGIESSSDSTSASMASSS